MRPYPLPFHAPTLHPTGDHNDGREIYQDESSESRWHLRADNGEILADSGEGYTDKDDLEDAIELLRTQAASAEVDDHTE